MSHKALVIGISKYAPPNALPGVARDTAAIAKLLELPNGKFPDGVVLLRDAEATTSNILTQLKRLLTRAKKTDTVLVFMAGHGTVSKGKGYFLPIDAGADLEKTAVSLSTVKELFDGCKCERVVFILDFCYSGAILARSPKAATVLPREFKILGGTGKVIIAACTRTQKSYETRGGHGWFTKSVLDGLKGSAKNSQGLITPHSLYDYVVHQVQTQATQSNEVQTPVFFGQTAGVVELADGSRRRAKKDVPPAKIKPTLPQAKSVASRTAVKVGSSTLWSLVNDSVVPTRSVKDLDEERVEAVFEYNDSEISSALKNLRSRYQAREIRFAHANQGYLAHVKSAEFESLAKGERCTLRLTRRAVGALSEFAINGTSARDIAELRARKILLDEEPPKDAFGYGLHSMVLSVGGQGKLLCPLRVISAKSGRALERQLMQARLECVFQLCAHNVVEHVLDLTLTVRKPGPVEVKFRGRRASHGYGETAEIKVAGTFQF